MLSFNFPLLVLLLVGYGQCRDLFSADLPEVSGFILEKNKPLQLPTPHEEVQISGLKGTLYSDSLSQLNGVKVLRIKHHQLTSIEKGALCSAPDVKELEVDFFDSENSLTHLTKDMFANCDHVEELLLKFHPEASHPYQIDEDAFEDMKNLKKFIIQSYPTKHLKKNFFKLPHNLKEIGVAGAEIEQVDGDVFEDFKNLEKIIIIHNRKWTNLPKNLFKGLTKLNSVQLRENGLKDLTWEEFDGLTNVKTLDIASNKISSFNAAKIAKAVPNLEHLFIELNPLKCKQKEAFAEELIQKIGHPVEISYKFDPGFYDSCEHED